MAQREHEVVFSKTLPSVEWENSHLVREIDHRALERMKREQGRDMIVFGSGSIVRLLTDAGLIDEYQFCVNPVLLGSGQSLPGTTKGAELDLLESRTYRSGNIFLRYARRNSTDAAGDKG